MRLAPLLALALLAACGRGDDGPGGVTRNEQKALDDAAEMVESQQLSPSAAAPAQPAPAATAPQSN